MAKPSASKPEVRGANSPTESPLEDKFVEAFKASRGKVDPKLKLGF